jgi:hypothetical protein
MGPQGRSGRVRKISPAPVFDPWTVQPVASHYTDRAITAPNNNNNRQQLEYCCYCFCCLLSQAFPSWHFSGTTGDPHRSGFKFHTAVLSVFCVLFLVQLSAVVTLSNDFLV